jgi:hypothetical protein
MGTGGSFPEGEGVGEVPPITSNSEVKNQWSYASAPPIYLHGMPLLKSVKWAWGLKLTLGDRSSGGLAFFNDVRQQNPKTNSGRKRTRW